MSASYSKFSSPSILDNGAVAASALQSHQNIPLPVKYGFRPNINLNTPTRDLLSYIFAPPDDADHQMPFSSTHGRKPSPYDAWGDQACRLENDSFKAEYVFMKFISHPINMAASKPNLFPLFTLDLVEVFFQIVHTRIPLLNPAQFRDRLQLGLSPSSHSQEPLHPALVATVLAWGTKFSEHPLLVADRRRPGGQSLLAKTLIDRARDLAEALKVHRIPKADHVVIGLLIEPLQSLNAESRGMMVFAWWMALISDAYASVYYRRKPVLDDEDYDVDFYTGEPLNTEGITDAQGLQSPRDQLEGYYGAAHSLARTARSMSRHLWKPVTDVEGIPFDVLQKFTVELTEWRDKYLTLVGVPSNFKGDWDFVSAVSSCASDATYHVMWIILFNALDDFGVREIQNNSVDSNNPRIEEVKRKILEEALHGALRIAGLAAVLTSNGYLRLDPAVMHVSCIQAGTLLARLGRQEVKNCIEGLEQYSHSYEEAGAQALEMGKTYAQALAGEPQFRNMGRSVPARMTPDEGSSTDDHDTDMKEDRVHM
ncbi:hypothetical protein H0H81_009361, partial [Sphagnurus paluster]